MKKTISIFIILIPIASLAQLFIGGIGDGYAEVTFSQTQSITRGGHGDGYGTNLHINGGSFFKGSDGDGYNLASFNNLEGFFKGSDGDGYNLASFNNLEGFFKGSDGDGHDVSLYHNNQSFFIGGTEDGYKSQELLYYLKWTGSVGSGWNVASNWKGNRIPNDSTRVLIPASPPIMPAINAGTFLIGPEPGGNYKCKSLWIQAGADLLTRVNCFVINRSEIIIDGVFRFRNPSTNAILNEGKIVVKSGGILKSDY
jgi:hypothetical protein